MMSWLACSLQKHVHSTKKFVMQNMGEITFKIRQGQEDLTVVQCDSLLGVAQAKQALLDENTSWFGSLQKEGSSNRGQRSAIEARLCLHGLSEARCKLSQRESGITRHSVEFYFEHHSS